MNGESSRTRLLSGGVTSESIGGVGEGLERLSTAMVTTAV